MSARPTPNPNTEPNDCETLRPLLSSFADGQATPAEAARVEAHLSGCAPCTSHLAFLRTTSFVFQRSAEMPPPQLFERIAAATYAAPPVPTWKERVAAWFNPTQNRLAFGTALAAGIVAAFILPRTGEMNKGPMHEKFENAANGISKPSPGANMPHGTGITSKGAAEVATGGKSAAEELRALKGTGLRVASLWGKQASDYAAPVSRANRDREDNRTSVRAMTTSAAPRGSAASVAGGPLPTAPVNRSKPVPSTPTPKTTDSTPTAAFAVTPAAPEVTRTPRPAASLPIPAPTPGSSSVAITDRVPITPRPAPSIAAAAPKTGREETTAPATTAAVEPGKLDRARTKPRFTLGGAGTDASHSASVVAPGMPSGDKASGSPALGFVNAPVN